MLSKFVTPFCLSSRGYATGSKVLRKVAVLGAGGGIGQPLSLLLKNSPLVSKLALYDVANVKGVAEDLSHIETPAIVTSHTGPSEIEGCLTGSHIVLIPAGVPRKPGMTRDDLFNVNAKIVANLAYYSGKYCPDAMVCIITNPVNSTVPIAAAMLQRAGIKDLNKLFGVTTLDIVRANTFIAQSKNLDIRKVSCPVIGGHSGTTILPLISQCTPHVSYTHADREKLISKIQEAGTEVVKAKAGAGSATLSMAYSAMRFTTSLLEAMSGSKVVECAFVASNLTECEYVSAPLSLGVNGVEKHMGFGDMDDFEKDLLKKLLPELKDNIEKGKQFAKNFQPE